jgi:hypothetical protein
MSIFTNPSGSTQADTARYVTALLDLLGDRDPVDVLHDTPDAVRRFVGSVPSPIVTIPEVPGKWSLRDVVQHLADSELVAGFRLRLVLAQDRPPLTGYDQDLWADRLRYHEVDVQDALEQFTVLRRANLRLWANLDQTELMRIGLHSERGEESLGHLRRLYAAHDLLHLRQLERIGATLRPVAR